ncbi:hypothetical protein V8C44DRAFT_343179 [Trichoderma aethiopicum]
MIIGGKSNGVLVFVLPWTACFFPFLILPFYFMSLSLLYVVIFGFCVFLEYGVRTSWFIVYSAVCYISTR